MTKSSVQSYKVVNSEGKEVGTIALDPEIFDAAPAENIVHDVVVWQLAKRRAGTHKAIRKGEMRGGGAKPWRQKGTGRARVGSANSPLWVGGASAHGPLPRDYTTRVTKRARCQALCSVLSEKARNSSLIIVDKLAVPSGKTKDFVKVLGKIGVKDAKTLVVCKSDESIVRSSRNVPKVLPLNALGVNVYDLLRHRFLVCDRDGIKALEDRIKGTGE